MLLGLITMCALSIPVDLKPKLDAICDHFHGRMGYCVIDLTTGDRISKRGDERFPTASTIKTAVALEAICEVEEGKLKWTDQRAVPASDHREVSMWSYFFKDGVKADVDGWVNLMITVSDNTATILLRSWLTPDKVNARMESLGLHNTKVLWDGFPPDQPNMRHLRESFGLGMTTPNEMAKLYELLYKRKAAGKAGCEKLMRILSHQYWDDYAGSSVPVDIKVASKSGGIDRSRSEAAIVFAPHPYILTVYTDDQKDQRWVDDNEGVQAIRQFCRLVYAGMMPDRPYQLPAGSEKFWATGGGIE